MTKAKEIPVREIKFRGKRQWNNEWLVGNLIIDKSGKKYIVPCKYFEADGHHLSYEDDTDTPVFVDQESVGQFTGLHDKNGKEIYEGDILGFKENNSVFWHVHWDENKYDLPVGFVFGCFGMTSTYPQYMHPDIKVLEVIGNIHENPELLNG
jgi:hypothetical protein